MSRAEMDKFYKWSPDGRILIPRTEKDMIAQQIGTHIPKEHVFTSLAVAMRHYFLGPNSEYSGIVGLKPWFEEYKKLTKEERKWFYDQLISLGYVIDDEEYTKNVTALSKPYIMGSSSPIQVQPSNSYVSNSNYPEAPELDDESVHAGYTVGDEHPAAKAV